jgi:hypothetical protein
MKSKEFIATGPLFPEPPSWPVLGLDNDPPADFATCKIEWKSIAASPPRDGKRILIAAPGLIKTGSVGEFDGEPCFVCDSGVVVHCVFAWAELPTPPPWNHGAPRWLEVRTRG